jgi:hypothetical protein
MTTLKGVLRTPLQKIHPGLLAFLVLLLNVKLVVKAVAILASVVFGLRDRSFLSVSGNRCLLFYPALIAIALFDAFLYGSFFKDHYALSFLLGAGIWVGCFVASGQVRRFVERIDTATIVRTVAVFFVLNAIVSLIQLATIVVETGALNPYRYQGNFQKYFVNTGDYIKGISFDTSTTNAALSAFGVLFFLQKRSAAMLSVCLLTLVLTGSNLVNILLLACLVLLFLFRSDREMKSLIAVCVLPLIIFWARVSPQNSDYVSKLSASMIDGKKGTPAPLANTPFPPALLSPEESRDRFARHYLDSVGRKIADTRGAAVDEKPLVPTDNIHTPPFQHRDDTGAVRKTWFRYAAAHHLPIDSILSSNIPGKGKAVIQTASYFASHPAKSVTGAGMGNFASKLAFKTAALGIGGSYPERYRLH